MDSFHKIPSTTCRRFRTGLPIRPGASNGAINAHDSSVSSCLRTTNGATNQRLSGHGLALFLIGMLARVTRSAMVEALDSEHVTVARSRGVPEGQVVRRHAFRNSLGTVLTTGGLTVSTLLVCTILVETAFSIGGVGQLLELSTTTKDFPTVQAISLIIVALFMAVNLIVDLVLPLVNPRVTLGSSRSPSPGPPSSTAGPASPGSARPDPRCT